MSDPDADTHGIAAWLRHAIERLELRILAADDVPAGELSSLQSHAGSWSGTMTTWLLPGQPFESTAVTCTARWIFGNRFLERTFEGTFRGKPFSAVHYLGYDDAKQRYVAMWLDTAATTVLPFTGSADEATGALTLTSRMSLVDIPGLEIDVKAVATMPDANHFVSELYVGRFGIWMKAHRFDLARVSAP